MLKERLVILTGPDKNKIVVINGCMNIGRNPDNEIQLNDLKISRRHALIEQTSSGAILRDLHSGNGTFVGNRRILEYQLTHGDIVRIGEQQLRFEREGLVEADSKKTVDSKPSPSLPGVVTGATFDAPGKTPGDIPGKGVRFDKTQAGQVQSENAENIYQTFFARSQITADSDQLKETQKRLHAIYQANHIITSERDINLLFERVMEQIFELIPSHNGIILLADEHNKNELISAFIRSGLPDHEVVISSSIVRQAYEQGEAIITYDAAGDNRFDGGGSIIVQNIASAMCVPLTHQSEHLGVIYVDTRGTTNAFTSSDLEMLVALAGPAAIAIKNAQYVRKLERAYEDTLTALANAIEMRDHYTVGHTWRVTNFSLAIAQHLGWSDEKLKEVRMGGILHDVGKIAIDDAILRKPGNLTDEEYGKIKIHPEKGAQLMQDVDFLQPLIPYCLYHHERYDGKGYPFGLEGDNIPIEGRVVAVADTLDALTSNRPYRKGFDPEKAIGIIEEGRGTQFDPECADALISCYRSGKIDRILQDYLSKDEKSIACPFCSTFIRVPEGINVGDTFSCTVCHRGIELCEINGSYFGQLMSHNAITLPTVSAKTEKIK